MSKDEALKLALEIIETHHGEFDYANEITAIKEALEKPQQEPVADVRAYAYSGVAKNGEFFEAVLREGAKVTDGDKLYTSPPQRSPLTDEETTNLWNDCIGDRDRIFEIRIAFARAIEAAHGIKTGGAV